MIANIEKAKLIVGWTFEPELQWLGDQASRKNAILEVGCWKGRCTRAMVDNTDALMTVVDHWSGPADLTHFQEPYSEVIANGPDFVLNQFKHNLADVLNQITIFNISSVDGARVLAEQGRTFDMIFIDADHSYEHVKEDIQNYRPLVQKGGILCGRDWSPAWPGVVQAVKEMIPAQDIKIGHGTTIWCCTL